MEDPTSQFKKSDNSKILGVSLRGWIAVLITATVCIMSAFTIEVKEPLYTLAGLAIGFYFGQKDKP